jgi:glycosyltransferase involved in cell wall biosynthesis
VEESVNIAEQRPPFHMHMNERLAIIWTNLGPYHMARIDALKPYFEVQAIELASGQRKYQWWRGESDASVYTLTSGDAEDQNQFLVAFKLWRKLSLLRPRIVLVPGYSSLPALCAAVWSRTHRAKAILMSESNYEDHRRSPLVEAVKRVLVTLLFDGGVVGGKRAASYLQRLGLPSDCIAQGYDVVDNEYFLSRATRCRLEANDLGNVSQTPYFLFVGRLAPEKNISTLLEAFRQYLNFGGTWSLVIVGDGPLNKALTDQASAESQSRTVIFTGRKSVHELPPLYALAGCFILPSLCEPWGLVVNEAMASGLPVIVSSSSGCVDDLVEDGSNGFIIDANSASTIALAMLRMSQLSSEKRTKMGERSKEIIADYSPERWSGEVRRIVNAVEKGKRG